MMKNSNFLFLAAFVAVGALIGCSQGAHSAAAAATSSKVSYVRVTREAAHSMMHNHLSRKVFDRACAASKDTIDEIIACLTTNEGLMKAVKIDTAKHCYKEAFHQEFDEKDVIKHKELICNNRDKFESMTTCIYKKTGELMDAKQMEKLTETLVDVGLCIINALDG